MHLLLVEDDERLARALTRLLEEDRHVVEHAPDGRTGLELATGVDGLDCVILDIGLPAGGEFGLMFAYIAIIYFVIRDFGSAAQAGFGVGQRVTQMIFLPAMAIGFSIAPVAGQNFGDQPRSLLHLGHVSQPPGCSPNRFIVFPASLHPWRR